MVLYIGCKGGPEESLRQAAAKEHERSHTITGHTADAEVLHVISHDNVAGPIHCVSTGYAVDGTGNVIVADDVQNLCIRRVASGGLTVPEVGIL
jgi:hypothetical protein